jgi:sugar lactone lactonase YvrE
VVARGELWVGTRSGAASAPLSAPNLTDPASWRTWRAADGLPSDVVTALLASGDTVYAGTRAGIAMNAAGAPAAWSVVPGSAGLDVVAMEAAAPPCGGGFFVTPSLLGVIGAGAASVVDTMPGFIPAAAAPGSGSSVWIGSTLSGAYAYDLCGQASPDTLFSVLPAGPPSRRFISVEVDANGWIWSATGSRNGEGFMRYDGSGWRSYTVASDPRLGINEYYTMSVGPDNVKYAGSWGAGLAVLTPDGEIDTVYNTANGFPSSVLAEPFVVVGGVAVDQAGAAWVTTRTPPPDTSLTLLPAGGGIGYLHGCGAGCTMRTPNNVFNDVVIDFNGTKWFTNFSRFEPEPAVGFYYYNESFDLPGTSQGWGRLTTADGLTSLQVWSAAIDLFGDLWIGSERGITIIYNTADPRRSAAVYHPLPDQVIQDILVDPLNRKWVATKRGVFLLSTDGTSIVENFTVASTGGRLLDDDVASLAMDRDGGVVWFGTEKGLSGVRTAAIAPVRAYGELLIYPNPFVLPAAAPVTIDGLVSGSSLKLFSIDGALVRELGTPGGRIGFWDGRDEAGNDVGTGVYLVVAYEENGTETARGKIAVVRK